MGVKKKDFRGSRKKNKIRERSLGREKGRGENDGVG